MKVNDKDYESVIPTAASVIFPLENTDIPRIKEIVKFLKQSRFSDIQFDKFNAIQLEARYKQLNSQLEKEGITQVLELASGFTARGIEFCKNPDAVYVEIDLPEVVKLKKQLFKKRPKNLHILEGNAINDYSFCSKYFDKNKKVVVINQGLLRYLTFEEKAMVAQNVKTILQKHGGVWITSDFTSAAHLKIQNNTTGTNKIINNLTPRNNIHRFESLKHVKEWLFTMGFEIKSVHENMEVENLLTSPKNLGVKKEEIINYLEHAIVCVIKLKE